MNRKPLRRPKPSWESISDKHVHQLYPKLSRRFDTKERNPLAQQKQLIEKGIIENREGFLHLTPLGFFELLLQEEKQIKISGTTKIRYLPKHIIPMDAGLGGQKKMHWRQLVLDLGDQLFAREQARHSLDWREKPQYGEKKLKATLLRGFAREMETEVKNLGEKRKERTPNEIRANRHLPSFRQREEKTSDGRRANRRLQRLRKIGLLINHVVKELDP